MTDLTDKWKKGEFIICNAGKCQYYYVQNEKQQEVIKTEYCLFDDNTPNWQILAEVPSYEKWQAKLEENAQLKDLLEECRSPINYALCLNLSEEEKIEFRNLLSKIKRALGEDK